MNALETIYEKLMAWIGHTNIPGPRKKALDKILEELSDAAKAFTMDIDRSSLKSCLDGVAFHKNLTSQHLKNVYLQVLSDIGFSQPEIAALFRVSQQTISGRLEKLRTDKASQSMQWGLSADIPASLEEVEKMEPDEFINFAMTGARRTITLAVYSNKIDKNSVDVARSLILAQDQIKRSDTEKMWKLNKRWLQFFTSEFVVHMTKILAPFKLKVDAKVLVGEALEEGYRDLYKLFVRAQEQREQENEMDKKVRQAKRRGKWKKPVQKVSGSIVLNEGAERQELSATEPDASMPEALE